MKNIAKSLPRSHSQTRILACAALTVALMTPDAHAQRALGIDVYEGQGELNWGSEHSSGVSFAWAKATEGTYYIDPDFVYNQNNGKSAGVYMGAYHFARPDLDAPGTEASYFWNEAGGYIDNDGKTIMPALDFETFNGLVGASTYSAWADSWCSTIANNSSAKGVKITPVLYCSTCQACNLDGSAGQWIPWIANPSGESAQTGSPWGGTSCSTCGSGVWGSGAWTIWQYGGTSVDLDVFNGTVSAMENTLVAGSQNSFAPGPNAVSWGNNRIDVVCRGGGDSIYHKYFNGSWEPNGYFENIGGIANSGAGIASWGVNRLDAFTLATDNSLQHKYFDGTGWYPGGNWENLGGTLNSTPAAVSWGANRIDVVARGGNNNIYHKYFDGSAWQPNGYFENLSGTSLGAPAICSWGSGRLDVFCQGGDNALWHIYYSGGTWSTWASLGGSLTSAPAAVSWASGRIDVVVRGGNNQIYHKYFINGQGWFPSGSFENLGGDATSDPGISSWGVNRLDVFCRGADNSLQHSYFNGSTWSTWQSLGGALQ